jgi:MOSC domain-containing protein YiiM
VAEVLYLFQSLVHGEPVREFDEVFALENKGFRDCLHGRRDGTRQVLVMDWETLEEFGITPGSTKENITTRGLALGSLLLGQRLRIGEALLEVTQPCPLCRHLEDVRQGLQEAIRGRRGLMCRVIEFGRIRRGDRIEIIGEPVAQDC